MKTLWVYGGLLALLALGQVPGAEALQCAHQIVSEGDSSSEVLAKCGPPTVQSQRVEAFPVTESVFIEGKLGVITRWIPVYVDVWTYNFGPHRLIYELLFREDRLQQIWTKGYGYDETK